jgi:hypothetical protein
VELSCTNDHDARQSFFHLSIKQVR